MSSEYDKINLGVDLKMQIKWIGQAGLLIDTGKFKIMVDPYLSDSVAKINPKNRRRMKVDENLFDEKPEVILIMHNTAR